MTTAAVTTRRFTRIAAQLLRALIAVGIALVLSYLLVQVHNHPAPAHRATPQPPTAAAIDLQRTGAAPRPTD